MSTFSFSVFSDEVNDFSEGGGGGGVKKEWVEFFKKIRYFWGIMGVIISGGADWEAFTLRSNRSMAVLGVLVKMFVLLGFAFV